MFKILAKLFIKQTWFLIILAKVFMKQSTQTEEFNPRYLEYV